MEKIVLNDGNKIPVICFGSRIISYSRNSKRKMFFKVIKNLLTLKFKKIREDFSILKIMEVMEKENDLSAIDTSRAYGISENLIGQKLKKDREKYFIITKISNTDQYNGNIKEALKDSLKRLNTDYVDLLLLHWPVTSKYIESWKKMEELKEEGLCKSIGVCNCNIHHLEEIKKNCKIVPSVNEIECHPLFTQENLREYCNKNNIQVLAYTATARMDERLKNTVLVDIAKKYNKSLAQIILKWHIQIGNIPIFNTTNVKRYKLNIDIFDFELTNDEIKKINAININSRLRYDPDNCDFTRL